MAYIGKTPSTGIRNRFIYTATAGQTTFSGTDDHSRTLSYTDAEFTDVFLNGVKLDKSDYTATSGTSIVLDEGAAVDDILEVLAFDTFSVFSGEFSQDVTIGGTLDVQGGEVILDADGDTSITADTDDQIDFKTGGTDRMVIDGSGNVGIGDTTPLNASGYKTLSLNNTTGSLVDFRVNDADALRIQAQAGSSNFINIYNQPMTFHTNDAERMRIDSSGNVLVGKTSSSITTAGAELRTNGSIFTRDGGIPVFINRETSDGAIVDFRKDNTTVGLISNNGLGMNLHAAAGCGIRLASSAVLPTNSNGDLFNNGRDLGSSSYRWRDIYTNGAVNTSDQNEKQQIASLTDTELAAAKRISALFKTFKWNDAVASKGDNARTHAGVIAQDVKAALVAEGLDAADYSFWCSDTWWEADEAYTDDDGNAQTRTVTYDTQAEAPAGATERTLQSVRYAELMAFVGAATEQRLADIETRLTALEASD